MSELVQWVVVGLLVLAAAVYLARRILRPRGACAPDRECAHCPLSPDLRKGCEDRQTHK